MTTNTERCAFCDTLNDPNAATCLACGGPMDVARVAAAAVLPIPPTPVEAAPIMEEPLQPPAEPLKETLKEGIAAVGAGLGLAGVGGLLMRTLAEALAIVLAAIMVGFNAGRVSPFPQGWFLFLLLAAGGGAAVGLAVGSVVKRGIFALFSAPFGALVGIGAALALKLNALRTPWLPLFTIAGACLFALLGGRPNSSARFTRYQRIRPLLGALGGIFFALIGFGAGWIVH